MNELKLFDLKKTIDDHLRIGKHEIAAFSFNAIYLWKDFFEFLVEDIDGALCIFAKDQAGMFMYLPPLREDLDECLVDKCFAYMEQKTPQGNSVRIENLTEDQADRLAGRKYDYSEAKEEYIYAKDDLVALRGSKYKAKRHDCNRLEKNHLVEMNDFDPTMKDVCGELYDRWADLTKKKVDDVERGMIDENRRVHKIAFEESERLDLIGKVLLVDGDIKAYTFGYELNPEYFCIVFEIGDPDCAGASSLIFREFCSDEKLRKYKYINTMDCLLLDRLKRPKESYHPIKKVKSFNLKRKNG
jgi:hypothetical protein